MADTKRFAPWAVVLDADTAQAGTDVYINGVTNVMMNTNLATRVEGGDGLPFMTYASLISGAPVVSFTTSDLKAFLDECGVNGMLVDSGASGDGIDIYFQRYTQGGTRTGASVSHQTTIGDGILVPRTLNLSHQGRATITAEVVAFSSDGTTSPLAFTETASLPSSYPTVDLVHTLGKVDLNSTALEGVTDLTYDFGINLLVEGADSNIYPTVVSIQSVTPSITLSSKTIDITSTLTENGLEYATTQVVFYARKRDEGGVFVADGTAEHIKFTLNKCRIDPVSIGGDPAAIGLRITPWYTNAGSPVAEVTINTASAIT